MNKNIPERKILKREVITDQVDPRMVEFRKSRGEFKPGCKQKTVRLEITEYEPGPDKVKMVTKFGFYEGEPPPAYREFFGRLYHSALEKSPEAKNGKDGVLAMEETDVLSEKYQRKWDSEPIYDESIFSKIDKTVHLHTEIRNVRSSAAACINALGCMANNKNDLLNFLNEFNVGVDEIITFPSGSTVGGRRYNDSGNIVFEWVGPKESPLGEKGSRGLNRTSIDAYVLGTVKGKVTQLLIEWKFTETYNSPLNAKRFSGIAGNERLRRYSICLAKLRKEQDFPFRMTYEGAFGLPDLCYEPFFQLLRMTLLAKLTTPLEFDSGLVVKDYRILHLSHSKNSGLNELTPAQLDFSPGLRRYSGRSLHEVWRDNILSNTEAKKFCCGYWDQAIRVISDDRLKNYLSNRYLGYRADY